MSNLGRNICKNILIFNVFLIYNLLSFSSGETKITLEVEKDSEGKVGVLFEFFTPKPYEILVNGENQELDYNNEISVSSGNTIVILSWINGPTDCSRMFYGLKSIISIDLSEFDHTGITNMLRMFDGCTNLQSINFHNFDSSLVTDMYSLFFNDQSLSYLDLSNLDVSNVEDMRFMFQKSGIENINLKNLNTSSLVNMYGMFSYCHDLISLDLSFFNTSQVVDMGALCFSCTSLEYVNLSNLDNSKVTDMSLMFAQCYALEYVDLNGFHTNIVQNMSYLFYHCYSLKSVDFSSFETTNLIDLNSIFHHCKQLSSIIFKNFNTHNVQNFDAAFFNCKSLISLDLSFFNTSNALSMAEMFSFCENLIYIDVSSFDTKLVKNMTFMFSRCYSLSSLNLINFDTSNVIDLIGMFIECYNIKTLQLGEFKNSLTLFLSSMFHSCSNLTYLDLSHFYTPNATYIYYMFLGCESLKSLDLSSFNTSLVEDMDSMFLGCKSLTSLNLSNFDTSKVSCMDKMFSNCINLEILDFRNIKLAQSCTFNYFLNNCKRLKYLNLFEINNDISADSEYDPFNNINDNITICINDEKNIPSNFDFFKNLDNSRRDCTNNCYEVSKLYLSKEFLCVDDCTQYNLVRYNSECIESCPEGFELSSENICIKPELKTEKINEYSEHYSTNEINIRDSNIYSTNEINIKDSSTYSNNELTIPQIESTGNYITTILEEYSNKYIESSGIYKHDFTEHEKYTIQTESSTYISNFFKNEITTILKVGKDVETTNKIYITNTDYINDAIIKETSIINKNTNIIDRSENSYGQKSDKQIESTQNIIYTEKIEEFKCNIEKCLTCSEESLVYDLCITCNENQNYYPKFNDSKNYGTFIDCYKNLEKYYLNGNIYEPCYESCQSCSKNKENNFHNCKMCAPGYTYIIEYNEFNLNCYKDCIYYKYYDRTKNKYYCTEEAKCPEKYSKLIPDIKECVNDCTNNDEYRYEFQNQCLKECPSNTEKVDYYCNIKCTKELPFEIVKTQKCVSNCAINELENNICIMNYISNETNKNMDDEVINNVQDELTSGYNTSNIDEGKDVVIQQKNSNTKVTISSTENQRKNENEKNNITTINLGECETKLKNHYKIPQDKYLYILRVDVPQEGMNMVKMGYEVYYPLYGSNLEKLDLSVCENAKIAISIPYEIVEDIEKLNSSSDYYNDICYTYTSEKGTDIIMKDRQQEYVDKNISVCEENCVFSYYNTKTGKAVCSCEIKIKLPLISEIKFDKNKLYDSFTNIKNIANINIMKCYKIFFSAKGIYYNYGCYIIIPIYIFHIITNLLFYLRELKQIKNNIKKIIFAKKNWPKLRKLFEKEEDKKITLKKNTQKTKQINKRHISHVINAKTKYGQKEKKYSKIYNQPIFFQFYQFINQDKNNHNPPLKRGVLKNNTHKIINKNIFKRETIIDQVTKFAIKSKRESESSVSSLNLLKKYEFCKEIFELNDYELNDLIYKEAIIKDQRTYCSYYLSLIRQKHLLIFSFFPMKDYNSQIIKIDLFFINFTIYFTVNALFFSDSTMHKIYLDEGDFNFIYQIPQILYSSLVSGIINIFLKLLALTGQKIIKIKQIKMNVELKSNEIIRIIKYKILFYYIISHILLLICWYYVGCFCAIYKNTQAHLIKDTIISFGLSFIYPFFIYLFPGIFRISALKNKKDKKENMYRFSKILQAI